MKPLSFLGFLKQYVRALSTQDTLSIRKLAKEATLENPRLREPLALYAVFCEKSKLLEAEQDRWINKEILQYSPKEMLAMLSDKRSSLPYSYKKVYTTYLSLSAKKQHDGHTKELLQKRIRQLQKERHISNYYLYKELGLNPGNVNAYLKHGDHDKVSLQTARRILDLAENKGGNRAAL